VQLVRQLKSLEILVPYHSIEDPAKLRRVLEATLLIEADLDLPTLLRHIVDEACSMTNARYGALGVLNDDRTALAEFVTVGLEPAVEARIGARPTGLGVLGLLISDPIPLRVARLDAHPEGHGFPAGHPPMTSFLGVPLKVRDEVYGNLYLTDKVGWSEFTADDEALIGALAVAAGIAIENARLHHRVTEAAVYEERDRLARDLHDTVIQRLFAIGLSLQSVVAAPTAARNAGRLSTTIRDIDDTIRQVRTSIFELGSDGLGRGTRESILALLAELRPMVGFEVHATFDGPVDTAVPDVVLEHLLAVLREAVTNVGRHARATDTAVHVVVRDGACLVRVVDDGCGIDASEAGQGGLGLGNLRRRAEKLHGQCCIESPESGGTVLSWQVPLTQ
jgi:signal transduction histidine kinase